MSLASMLSDHLVSRTLVTSPVILEGTWPSTMTHILGYPSFGSLTPHLLF